MATKIATANGNFTTAATWADVDATSLLDSEANNTVLTTAYVESATFTPGAITIDGIAVKVASRVTSPTGTISVRLAQAGATVAGTEVTINVSDLVSSGGVADSRNGWVLFKFAAPVLLVAATLYTVSAKTSNATQVALYRNATAGNWSRMLRTTTTGALAAGDNFFILGEWTAAATKTNRTVTMNQTVATDYGGGSTTLASFGIGNGCTLAWGTAAATAYLLRLSGLLLIYSGGTMTMGTDPDTGGTAVPRDSSAELQWDSAADGDFGFICWGTLVMQGLSRSSGKNVVQCLLNTDEAIGQTVLGVDTDTGWLNGDEVAIASTSQTVADAETGTLNGAAGASSITVSVAITAAHSGTSPNQAEVILITRNVRMTAVTTTAVWYGQAKTGSSFNCAWSLFRYAGSTTAAKTAPFYMDGTGPTSFTLEFCSFANSEQNAIQANATGVGAGVTFTLTDCTFYICGVAANAEAVNVATGSAGTWNFTRCTSIGDVTVNSSTFLRIQSDSVEGFTLSACRISSSLGSALEVQAALGYPITKLVTGCVFHCLSQAAATGMVSLASTAGHLAGVRFVNTQFRRSSATSAAIQFGANAADIVFETCTFVALGNGGAFGGTAGCPGLRLVDCVLAGDASFAQAAGFALAQTNVHYGPWRFENTTFGVGTAHTTADFTHSGPNAISYDWTFINCTLASATEFAATLVTAGNVLSRSVIRRQRKDGTTNSHESLYPNFGTVARDTVTVRSAGASEKLTPTVGSSAHFKLRSGPATYGVASGKKITFSVYVQKDGSYTGNAARLVLLANPALGIDADTVLDTHSVGSGTWELLSGQMTAVAEEAGAVQAVVECDGAAGNIYVDDWAASST